MGKRPLERPRRRWEDNIRIDLKEIGVNTTNWIHSSLDKDYWRALLNVELEPRVPYGVEIVNIFNIVGSLDSVLADCK